MTELSLPTAVKTAIRRLNEGGYEAYAVGGCVRDLLMGITPHDYDLCTSAHPDTVAAIFNDYRLIPTGLKHGTVTVLIDGEPLEITTFRTEEGYTDSRRPDRVRFVSDIESDLSRRDFTMNAMAYAPEKGLIDPFGGRMDIETGILRCVGEPRKRFSEDALRILRCLRFAARFRFPIEKTTAEALLALRGRLQAISAERLASELYGILSEEGAYEVLIGYPEVFCTVIPELRATIGYDQKNPHHAYDLYTHLCKTVAALPRDPVLRLAGLLHDIAKPACRTFGPDGVAHYFGHAPASEEVADGILRRLKLSVHDRERVTRLIHYHDGVIDETEKAVGRRLRQLGEEGYFDLLALQRADNAAQTEDPSYRAEHNDTLRRIGQRLLAEGACLSVTSLAVRGEDLMALGLRGPQIGNALATLLDAVTDGEVTNEKEALLAYLGAGFSSENPSKDADTYRDERRCRRRRYARDAPHRRVKRPRL